MPIGSRCQGERASEAELKKRTLTNLYNERPTWLQLAHKRLDEAVLDAYGREHVGVIRRYRRGCLG